MNTASRPNFWNTWAGVCTIVFSAGILIYLVTWHTAHFIGVLPFALLLLCPLMHLFMHGKHGGHSGHTADSNPSVDTPHAGHDHTSMESK